MGQPLDLLERVHQRHVGRDRRLHQVDLVEVLGGDRLLEDLLRQQPEPADHRQHGGPPRRVEGVERRHHDGRGPERQRVGHHLVAEDEQPLFALELVAQEEREVEERARGEEVGARQRDGRQQEVEPEPRAPRQPPHQAEDPVRRERGDRLAAGVDQPRHARLPEPDGVDEVHPYRQPRHHLRRRGDQQAGQHRHGVLGQVGILAEADRGGAERDDRQQDHDGGQRLRQPPEIHQQGGRHEEAARHHQEAGVAREDLRGVKQNSRPRRGRTAPGRSPSRSTARSPPGRRPRRGPPRGRATGARRR